MSQPNDLDIPSEYLSEFSKKFPQLKTQFIKKAINDFNYDFGKINNFLMSHSSQESISTSGKSSIENNQLPDMFSFTSFNSEFHESDSNSPVFSKNQYRNSSELSTIASQNCDLKRLEDAFKGLESNREDLNRELTCLKEIGDKRKSVPHFPTAHELEKFERSVNRKFAMPTKSISYANDLRKPSEMNARYPGFRPPYNPSIEIVSDNNNNHSNRRHSENQDIPISLNPNLYASPKPKKNLLSPLKKSEEKRNSAQFAENFQIPEEFTGHKQGHYRQKSDPWAGDNFELQNEHSPWICSQCLEANRSLICSFCSLEKSKSKRN